MNRDYTKPNCSMEIDKVCDKMETESMCKGSFLFQNLAIWKTLCMWNEETMP
jgi:hypothetical protein